MRQAAAIHFPRLPLMGAIALVVATVLAVAAARVGGVPAAAPPNFADAPVATRSLNFLDQADGSILVKDAATDTVVARVAPGSNGFLRGALRGVARVRRIDGGNMQAPFVLARWSNRHLTLEDPTNGTKIDFLAFGPTNRAVFEAFLPTQQGASP
jgi:putative photosynthetic complex assembly protein